MENLSPQQPAAQAETQIQTKTAIKTPLAYMLASTAVSFLMYAGLLLKGFNLSMVN